MVEATEEAEEVVDLMIAEEDPKAMKIGEDQQEIDLIVLLHVVEASQTVVVHRQDEQEMMIEVIEVNVTVVVTVVIEIVNVTEAKEHAHHLVIVMVGIDCIDD